MEGGGLKSDPPPRDINADFGPPKSGVDADYIVTMVKLMKVKISGIFFAFRTSKGIISLAFEPMEV